MKQDSKLQQEKIDLAAKAISFFPKQGLIGLGGGTTVSALVEGLKLIKLAKYQFITASKITSLKLQELAIEPVAEGQPDICFDGADYIDRHSGLILKGKGGALLKEKILGSQCAESILMVDESKFIEPTVWSISLEIHPFLATSSSLALGEYGKLKFRTRKVNKKPLLSDSGNLLADLELNSTPKSWPSLNTSLKLIPGILETGIFFYKNGSFLSTSQAGDIRLEPLPNLETV